MAEREKEDSLTRIKADLEEHASHIENLIGIIDRAIASWRRPSASLDEQNRITRDAIYAAFPDISEQAFWACQAIVSKNEMNVGFLGNLDYWKLKLSMSADQVAEFEIKQIIMVLFNQDV